MNKSLNRLSLKQLFSNGSRPTQSSFESLIDSMLNTVDDGISKNAEDGLILSPEGKDSSRVVSLYENIQDAFADWTIELGDEENRGFTISEPTPEGKSNPRIFFKKGGFTGIETLDPQTTFHVHGIAGADSRMGTFKNGLIAANGHWHTVVPDLDGCNAFEIVAQVGKVHTGKYAMAHAIAVSTFGKSKINLTQANYGFCWNRIAFRFHGKMHNYSLQMKTRSDYGKDQNIKFHITKMWDIEMESLLK